jgi:hypothetical protein
MGPGIIFPLVILAVAVPAVFTWAKKSFKDGSGSAAAEAHAPAALRLTSNALRNLSTPPWRVVFEIADDRLDGVGHVAIGPSGVFALVTSTDPLPPAPTGQPDPHEVAAAAIVRGRLDDALRRCAMSTDRLVTVHWGPDGGVDAVETVPGAVSVSGRSLTDWLGKADDRLTAAQVDLAWQTVTTSIGRPDPLA